MYEVHCMCYDYTEKKTELFLSWNNHRLASSYFVHFLTAHYSSVIYRQNLQNNIQRSYPCIMNQWHLNKENAQNIISCAWLVQGHQVVPSVHTSVLHKVRRSTATYIIKAQVGAFCANKKHIIFLVMPATIQRDNLALVNAVIPAKTIYTKCIAIEFTCLF